MSSVVFDTSTLVLLAKIDLLQRLTQDLKVLIPSEVQRESTHRPDLMDARLIQRLIEDGAIRVTPAVDHSVAEKLGKDFALGPGEAACLAVAWKPRWAVATDDARAIKACTALGIPWITALTVIVRSSERKLISRDMALAKLEKLKRYGWYDPALLVRIAMQLKGGSSR